MILSAVLYMIFKLTILVIIIYIVVSIVIKNKR